MMKNQRIILWAVVVLGVAGMLGNAYGANITWNVSTGGNWNTAANWNPVQVPTVTDTAFFNTMVGACTLDVFTTVSSIKFTNAYSGKFYFNNKKLTVTNIADFRFMSGGNIINGGSDTLNLAGSGSMTIYPATGRDTLPNLLLTPASGTIMIGGTNDTLVVSSFTFGASGTMNLTASQGILVLGDMLISMGNLNALNGYVDVMGNFSLTGGSFNAPSGFMHVGGGWNHTAGSFVHSGGTIVFNGPTGSGMIHAFAPFNSVDINSSSPGTKMWTISGSPLNCNATLYLSMGTLNLGVGTVDSVGSIIAGAGGLDFNSSTLKIGTPTVNFGSLGSLNAGTGKLEFKGLSAIDFTPKPGALFPEIVQNFGGTTNLTGPLHAKGLTIKGGTFRLGSSLLRDSVGFVSGINGMLDFNNDTLDVGDTVNLFSMSVNTGSGFLRFVNNTPKTFVPKNGGPNPRLIKAGTGTTTLSASYSRLKGPKLQIYSGTFALGTLGICDTVDTIETFGGGLDFGSCTLAVACHNVDLSGLTTLTPGTGALKLTGNTYVIQQFKPKYPAAINPIIIHSGSDTIQLMDELTANGFIHQPNAGGLDLNGHNIAIVNSGNFTVIHSQQTPVFKNLGGRTINVAGNVNIAGESAYMVGLNPGSEWFLNAGGQLAVDFVNLAWCNASGGNHGIATNSPNGGNNTNWTFVKQWLSGGDMNWATGTNWSPTGLPDVTDSVVFSGSGNCFANLQSQTVMAIKFSGYTGTFSFMTDTLSVLKDADFSGATGIIDSGYGAIKFIGSGSSTLKAPGWPNCLPTIYREGAGTVSVLNAIKTKGVIVKGGLFQFATSGVNDTIIQAMTVDGGTVNLGTNNSVHIGTFNSTGGTLNFGSGSTLDLKGTGSPDFGQLASIVPGTGTLMFSSSSPGYLYFNFNSPQIFPRIVSAGGMDTIIVTNSLHSSCVKIDNGLWRWDNGGSGNTPMIDSIVMTGGTMDFSKSTVYVKTGNANFLTAAKIVRGQGRLRFIGTSGMQQHLYPPPTTDTLPAVDVYNGSDVYIETSNLNADSLNLQYGTLFLNGNKAFCKRLVSQGGGLNIGSDTLTIRGIADFSGLSPLTLSTGTVVIRSENMKRSILTPGNVTFNNLVLWNNGAGPSIDTIDIGSGSFTVNGDLVFRDNKTISATNTSVWRFDVGNPSVMVYGNVKREELSTGGTMSSTPNLFMGNNAWTCFKKVFLPIGSGSGKYASVMLSGSNGYAQCCSTYASISDSLGSVHHLGTDTLRLLNSLRCLSFSQNAGILDLNGMNLSVTSDFTASSSSGTNFAPLGGSTLTFGGDAHIYGSPTNLANLVGGSMYNIYIASGHSLTADWAKIGDCSVNGGAGTGYATNSRKMNVNTFGWNITGMSLVWAGSVNSSFKNLNNWLPAILPTDSDNVIFDVLGAGHNCLLDTSTGVRDITFASGYSGTFDFSTKTLTVTGNADFSNVGSIANTSGTLMFNKPVAGKQYFTPKAGATFPSIYQNGVPGGGDTVALTGYALTAGKFHKEYGTWEWGDYGATHSVQSITNPMSGEINFGNSTVRISDSLRISSNVKYLSGSVIELVKASGAQPVEIYSTDTLPAMHHTASGVMQLGSNLKCKSFANESGSMTFNGYNLYTQGDMVFNTGAATFSDLPGRRLAAGGKIELNGNAGDSIIVNPAAPKCTLDATGPLHASYAVIGNCVASGSAGYAGNSRDAANNVSWSFVSAGVKKWAAGAGSNYWNVAGNWLPSGVPTASDSVVFDNTSTQTCIVDANGSAKSITFTSGYNGLFDFLTSTLNVSGSADFTGCSYVQSSGGVLSFSGNGFAFLTPGLSGNMPSIQRASGSGTLTIIGNPLNADTLSVLSGTINFGSGLAHTVQTIKGSAGATLNFGSNTSVAVWRDADLSGLNIVATTGDSLVFNGYFGQTFSPTSAATNLTMVVQKNDSLLLGSNNLQIDKVVMYSGALKLGTGHSHLIHNIECFGGVLDFGSSTVNVIGNIDVSGAQDIVPGTGTLMLTAAAGYQYLVPQYPDTLPAIVHAGNAALQISTNPLTCASFAQSGGSLSFGSQNVSALGNFAVSNGTATTFSGLDNCTITAGANATFSGTPGNLLNCNPALPWSLSAAGTLSFANAAIGRCNASASAHWPTLAVCADSGGNTKFDFVPPGVTVAVPVKGSYLNALTSVSGTAADAGSGVSLVQISLKRLVDNQYWNGSSWNAQLMAVTATGTVAWSYPTNGISFSDGGYAVQAQAMDSASNRGAMAADTFTIKTTTPAMPTISIVNNNGFTNLAAVQLALSATGADSMRFQLNAAGWTPWEVFTNSKLFTIAGGGEGMKKVNVMYEDKAGNATSIVSDSVLYDFTPPQSPLIVINDNSGFTGSPTPQLTLAATGADSMRFMVNGTAWSVWEPFATVKNNLDISLGGNGFKVVAATYKDKAGNICVMIHDSTIYDSRLPAVTSVTVLDSGGFVNTSRPTVQIAVVNADSMRIALPPDTAAAAWKAIVSVDSIIVSAGGDGVKKVFVQVKTVGNTRSVWVFDSTVYDATPPQSPTITIVDNNGYTGSPTPQISLSAISADSMEFQLNTEAWSAWQPYSTVKGNFVISSGGDGLKRIFVRFKDRAYNISAAVSDSVIYDTRLPAVTSVAILDSNGYLNSRSAGVQIGTVNADSMRVALSGVTDTGAALWKKAAAHDTIDITPGAAGIKRVCVQVKTVANVRSVWMVDSTVWDTTMPRAVVLTKGSFIAPTWPGAISGTASDPISGIKSIYLGIRSKNDSTFWNGSAWTKSPADLQAGRLANWTYPMPCPKIGTYLVASYAIDSAGNVQSPSDTAVFTMQKDTLPPASVTILRANQSSVSSMVLSWDRSISSDAESLMVCTSVKIPVLGRTQGKWGAMLGASRISDTLVDLPADGSWLHVAVYVRDSLGNWSLPAVDSIMLGDTVPPKNNCAVTLESIGDTALRVSWTIDTTLIGDAGFVLFGYAPFALAPAATPYPYRDTSFIIDNVRTPGLWRVATSVADAAGNRSPMKFDTITIKPLNTLPVLTSWSYPDSVMQDSTAMGRLIVSDPDVGDSIRVSWSTKPNWLTVVSQPMLSGAYSFVIGGRPAKSDSGWNRLNFGVFDKSGPASGPAFMVYDSVYVTAGPKVPVVVIRRDQTKLLNAAARFVLGTQNTGDTGVTYEVTLRALDDTSYVKRLTSKTGTIDLFPLCDGRYILSVTAVSAAGLRDTIGSKDTFTIQGATTHRFAGQTDTVVVSWQMVSVPTRTVIVPSSSPLGALFHWDELAGERDIYGYYHRVSETGQVLPGMGYWRRANDTGTVVVPRNNVLDSVVNITLYKGVMGWNQIASPFPYPVRWPYPGILWQWNDTTHDFVEADGVLRPWQGYWVMTDSTRTVRLENLPIFTPPALTKRNVAMFADKNNWQVRIVLSGAANKDAENILGFSADARNGYDASDAAKPPRMSDYQYMFFSHPEWKRGCVEYARDIRRTLSRVEAFTIGIAPGTGKQAASISFDGLGKVSQPVAFYLADEKDITPVEAGKSYAIEKSSKALYKTLFVTTDKNFIRNFPRTFNLGLPYPNPTRRMANIRYSLPYHIGQAGVVATEPYKVSIVLYDVMGRIVRQLVCSMKEPGNYSTWWDGKSNAGLYVAAGMYFCRLDAGAFSSVKRISVIK